MERIRKEVVLAQMKSTIATFGYTGENHDLSKDQTVSMTFGSVDVAT
jgi:hypothetical protein